MQRGRVHAGVVYDRHNYEVLVKQCISYLIQIAIVMPLGKKIVIIY